LWWRRRELTAYLWYGLFIVGMGSQNLLFLRGEPVWPHYSMATDGFLQPFQVAIVNGAAWELVFSMFAYRRPRWWSAVWLVLGAKAALIAWPASYTTAIQIDRVVGVASLPILVGLVGWRAIKGQRAARIVAVGMLVLLAVAALMLSAQTAFFTVVFGFSPIVPATLVFVGAMAYALADQFSANLVRLDSAYTAAKRFVPADFLTLLGRSEVVDVQRGDATQRQMTVLFADVRGFSTRSEKHTPEENFAWLNRYLESIEPAIRDNRGFVNQYYGDGIMALFDSADDAVRAALAMLVAVAPLRIGIGVHTGPLMLGTIGGRDRLDTGVVGDAVNTASRIESLTKQYERPLLISDATKAALTDHDDLRFEEIDRVAPKGKRQHITLYAVALGA
jgi:class 3 adenylate cyclase